MTGPTVPGPTVAGPTVAGPALVLVHGASHDRRCWDPTIEQLAVQRPDLQVLAVDLPGRGGTPGDLATLTIKDCVASVVADIDAAGLGPVVLVGHSMAGLTLPGVVAALGPERVQRLVLIACCIPPQGGSVLDTLTGPVRWYVGRAARSGAPARPMARPLARWAFCNGMTRQQAHRVLDHLVWDATGPSAETVDRTGLSAAVPRTWILTRRDRALSPAKQRTFIANLGGVDEVLEIDACHDVMVSHPTELARFLVGCTAARDLSTRDKQERA